MPSVDTNVLVRYLVKDDLRQHKVAAAFFEPVSEGETIFIPLTVALELEWVLRSRHGVNKEGIVDTYTRLLETIGLQFQEEASIEWALNLFSEYTADFADCLHIASSITHAAAPFVTFDKKAWKVPHALLPNQ